MNAAAALLQTIHIFDIPEPTLEVLPQVPETPEELIGIDIAFTHTNRYLYPGTYIGTVTDHRYCASSSNPLGWLELKVKSASFNLEKWVHEDNFVAYAWELPQAATAGAITAL